MTYPVVHKHLPRACRERGLTQQELCRRVGLRWGTWRGILQGRLFAKPDMALRIAAELGLTIESVPRQFEPIRPPVVVPSMAEAV